MKQLSSVLIVLSAVLVVMLGGIIFWLAERDPLAELPLPEYKLQAESQVLALQNKRRVEHVTLHSDSLGDIGIVISLPDPLPAKKLPLLIVLGGLGTGENNIRYVGDSGNNAVIGYDWPMPVHFDNGTGFLKQLPDLYQRLMTIPAQVTSAIEWLSLKEWADDQHVSLLGFSLGALAAPAIQDLALHSKRRIDWTILAYGGAPLGTLFANDPHIKPAIMRYALAPMIDLVLRPLEPTEHLPHLTGHFLVLQGRDDSLIPADARARLLQAVPQPKTVITFEGDHMGVSENKMELLQKIIDASKKWLIDSSAVNPT